jgi:hypothetical protein
MIFSKRFAQLGKGHRATKVVIAYIGCAALPQSDFGRRNEIRFRFL